MEVEMKQEDISYIKNHLNKNDIMFEWGSGGSTLYFSSFVKKYYSVEHSKKWYDLVSAVKPKNVELFLIEPNKKLTEKRKGTRKQLKNYVEKIDEFEKFDKILIDGRARVACAKQAISHLKKDSLIFFHDFWKRKRYEPVLKFYKLVDTIANQMAVFKK